jgi:hypothetical protein
MEMQDHLQYNEYCIYTECIGSVTYDRVANQPILDRHGSLWEVSAHRSDEAVVLYDRPHMLSSGIDSFLPV